MKGKRAFAAALVLLTSMGCDRVKPAPVGQDAGPVSSVAIESAAKVAPIVPGLWGSHEGVAAYEIRELPDGKPGLFTAEGELLVELLPTVIFDGFAASKSRTPPSETPFELVKLESHEGSGFSLFGRAEDSNGKYDLRVEQGVGDPRVHVSVQTRWKRDVTLQRLIVAFRTGVLPEARALDHRYEWTEVADEWVDAAHTPNIVTLGDGALHVHGRIAVEGIGLRRAADDRWAVEVELYHFENHPVDVAAHCDGAPIDGARTAGADATTEARIDLIVGAASMPLPTRWPNGARAGVALMDRGENDRARSLVPHPSGGRSLTTSGQTWFGASVDALPCGADGRLAALHAGGVRAAWNGEVAPTLGNLLMPTEADARGTFAFIHPDEHDAAEPIAFFQPSEGTAPEVVAAVSGPLIGTLKTSWGLIASRVDLVNLDVEGPTLAPIAESELVWLAEVSEIASRLVALDGLEIDFLPEGVVRVRNPTAIDLRGLTLLLPAGVEARYGRDGEFTNAGRVTSFDLSARHERLLQLQRKGEPFWTMRPAVINVVR